MNDLSDKNLIRGAYATYSINKTFSFPVFKFRRASDNGVKDFYADEVEFDCFVMIVK